MHPERPVVDYCPQSNEPGWSGLERVLLPAAIRSLDVGGAAELEVSGPEGTFLVTHAHEAAEPTPGRYTKRLHITFDGPTVKTTVFDSREPEAQSASDSSAPAFVPFHPKPA